jgi:hypothetical protein
MKHQPFESWIIDGSELTPRQAQELLAHLEKCMKCRQLQQGWQAAQQGMQTSSMASPAPDFSQRWRASLAERRARQQLLQMRRFLLLLISAAFALMFLLAALVLFSGSPAEWLIAAAMNVTGAIVWLNQIQDLFFSLFKALPPAVSIIFWILFSSSLSLLSLAWAFTLWRISIHGAHQK